MCQAYLETVTREDPQVFPVLNRYHLVANMKNAIGKNRAAEAKRLPADGCGLVPKHSQ